MYAYLEEYTIYGCIKRLLNISQVVYIFLVVGKGRHTPPFKLDGDLEGIKLVPCSVRTYIFWELAFYARINIGNIIYSLLRYPVNLLLPTQATVEQPWDRSTEYQVGISIILWLYYGIYNCISGTKMFVGRMLVTVSVDCGFIICLVVGQVIRITISFWDIF